MYIYIDAHIEEEEEEELDDMVLAGRGGRTRFLGGSRESHCFATMPFEWNISKRFLENYNFRKIIIILLRYTCMLTDRIVEVAAVDLSSACSPIPFFLRPLPTFYIT